MKKHKGYLKLGKLAIKNLFGKMEFPFGISIDVTNRCNLNCKHCYFKQQKYVNELSELELIEKIKQIKSKYPSIIHASWVGGEPLLRKDIVEKGMKMFPFNMVVTNGSIELPNWKNCVFNISVDGTKESYEKIRGVGLYDKLKKNIDNSRVKVNIACVLTKLNKDCVEDMLEEWSKTKVGGLGFDFYTPISGIKEDLWLNWQERDAIIVKLLKLKKKYNDFLLNPVPVLKLMLSKNAPEVTSNCTLPKAVVSIDPLGDRKLPCILGKEADCSKCGCAIPYFIQSVVIDQNIFSYKETRKIYVG